eukprot:CAMPEP_0172003968 /NCGR_PEP_ID=MMETSP1041-20130122/4214_1 /TAXON_ID=464988 /ORGANISM="Hemiselmis andersenii, Strain CCMP439" /LENGTH=169 /DNA_ID=CAMNT_0012657767 /DNA_START=385 /DNA_END=892 /DNA_ORIENTATION=-
MLDTCTCAPPNIWKKNGGRSLEESKNYYTVSEDIKTGARPLRPNAARGHHAPGRRAEAARKNVGAGVAGQELAGEEAVPGHWVGIPAGNTGADAGRTTAPLGVPSQQPFRAPPKDAQDLLCRNLQLPVVLPLAAQHVRRTERPERLRRHKVAPPRRPPPHPRMYRTTLP